MYGIARNSRTFFVITAIIAMGYLVVQPSHTRADGPAAPALADLQKEQISTLREAADLTKQLHMKGVVPAYDVIRENRDLLDTELQAAPGAKERMVVLADALAAAKDWETFMDEKAKAGLEPHVADLDAKAYRLQVEIRLASESAK